MEAFVSLQKITKWALNLVKKTNMPFKEEK
jgi:hypothetical protein